MRGLMCFLSASAVLCAHGVSAQMQPHKAEYILRLGAAANAPRIGTATEDLTLSCDGWRLKRDVKGEVPISTALKFNVASTLDSEERRSGDVLHYRSLQVQNGVEREVRGKVQRWGEEMRADIVSPDGPAQVVLPAPTLMPVASINHIIDRLRAGSTAFPTLTFDAQVIGDAFRLDIARILTDEIALFERHQITEHPFVAPLHRRLTDAVKTGLISFQPKENQIPPARAENECFQSCNFHELRHLIGQRSNAIDGDGNRVARNQTETAWRNNSRACEEKRAGGESQFTEQPSRQFFGLASHLQR